MGHGGSTGVSTSRAPGNASGLYSSFLKSSLGSLGRTVLSGLGMILGFVGHRKRLSSARVKTVAMTVVVTTPSRGGSTSARMFILLLDDIKHVIKHAAGQAEI